MPHVPVTLSRVRAARYHSQHRFLPHASYSYQTIRLGFIRKVYGILTAQLAVTFAIMCVFIYSESVNVSSLSGHIHALF